MAAKPLLEPGEADPVTIDNEAGRSVFFLTCDHAGRAIPRRLDGLGLPEHETRRHIAWDIGVEIPGNRNLTELARAARIDAIFRPYHDTIATALDRRATAGRESVLVALHSFTPVFKGVARPWHAAVLYNRDARLARSLFDLLQGEDGLVVGDNEPYRVTDLTDYTVPVHGERRGLPYVEIEIRQDQIREPAGQAAWAQRLARLLPAAYAKFLRR